MKKGQLEMGVTIMVLFIFFILLAISLIFYFRFTYQNIQESSEEIMDKRFSSLLSTIIDIPELQYSSGNVRKNYLDAINLLVFKENLDEDYYRNIFDGIDALYVEVVYPSNYPDIECTKINYPNCDIFVLIGNVIGDGLVYEAPVSIYYPEQKEFKIGKIFLRK